MTEYQEHRQKIEFYKYMLEGVWDNEENFKYLDMLIEEEAEAEKQKDPLWLIQ